MNSLPKAIASCALIALLFLPVSVFAQATVAKHGCFAIHVRINGKSIEDPRLVTLRTEEKEVTISREGGCFDLPADLLRHEKVAVSFTLPKDRIELPAVAAGFFYDAWDVDLADNKFSDDVTLPKHAQARKACAVVFHGGDPENALTVTPCRFPLSPKQGH